MKITHYTLLRKVNLLAAIMVSVGVGCSRRIEGPAPSSDALSPMVVCGEQITTVVTLSGEQFSPTVFDSLTTKQTVQLPQITLIHEKGLEGEEGSGKEFDIPDDPNAPESSRLRWLKNTEMEFDVFPELELEPGVYGARVTNPNGKTLTVNNLLLVVARPELNAIVPDLLCLDQAQRNIELQGQGFLRIDGLLPQVRIGTAIYTPQAAEGCVDLPGPRSGMQHCTILSVLVPEDDLPAGAQDVVLMNPEPAACQTENNVTLAVVEKPVLLAVEPDLFCIAQGDRSVNISGTGFVVIRDAAGDQFPEVTFSGTAVTVTAASGCTSINGTLLNAERCSALTVVVSSSPVGSQEVVITNPQPIGCSSEEDVSVAIAHPPALNAIEVDMMCNAEGDRTLILSGSGFVMVRIGDSDVLPIVSIGNENYLADSATDCSIIPGTTLVASSCKTLKVTVPKDAVGEGIFSVSVENPQPVGCSSTETRSVVIAPPPILLTATPDLFCSEGAGRTITLDGTGFVVLSTDAGDVFPSVRFGTSSIEASAASGCTAVSGTSMEASFCSTLSVLVPTGVVAVGEYELVVENPQPIGCSSSEQVSLFVAGAPAIVAITPPAVCSSAQPTSMDVEGDGFLRVANGGGGFVDPVVNVDNAPVVAVFSQCTPFSSNVVSGEICGALSFDVPGGGFADGNHQLNITNPAPADCTSSADFGVAPAPTVSSTTPFKVCVKGDTFSVMGSGFVEGSAIVLDGSIAIPTTTVSGTELSGDINVPPLNALLSAGTYDVSVNNGASCESNVRANDIELIEAPLVFFVDPPNVYNQIDMRITVWVSGIEGGTPSVGIRPSGTMDPLTLLANPSYNGSNKVQATIEAEAGILAGEYDVFIMDDPCSTMLAGVLRITDVLSVYVEQIDPIFGVVNQRTGVTMTSGVSSRPTGSEGFEQTPRAYLNPIGGGVATELRAVSFRDQSVVTAVVPDNILAPGKYQLLVMNPDGDVGLLDNAFTVLDTDNPPPSIEDLVPSFVASSSGQVVEIVGQDFPLSTTDINVTARCRDPRDTLASEKSLVAVVNSTDGETVNSTWDTSGLSGWVCVVRLANTLNSTFVDFSALSVTNASGNLNPFIKNTTADGTDILMNSARKALGAAAVRMNAQSRFLFAIGGEDETGARLNSVEVTPVDAFGNISSWSVQRNALPAPRSYTTATAINRHIYLGGGRTGTGVGSVSTEILRAYLLDPFEAPLVKDIDLEPGTLPTGSGLLPGVWYYRIAAVFNANEANNPLGESLPSEPFVLQIPRFPNDEGAALTLYWDGLANASAYRIYRTPMVGGIAGEERFLAQVPHKGGATAGQNFVDDGSLDNSTSTETPLPLGSLGTWHTVGNMPVAREGAATVSAPDPNDSSKYYLYVFGGKDGDLDNDTTHISYDWSVVTASNSSSQNFGTLQSSGAIDGAPELQTGRWEIGAVYVDERRGPVEQDNLWIYVLPGIRVNGGIVSDVTAFRVDVAGDIVLNTADDTIGATDDGSLSLRTNVNTPAPPKISGYSYVAGNNALHVMGGQGSSPSAGGREAAITGSPTLANWNAGTSLQVGRYLHATAQESAFIFLVGGQTDVPEAASRSSERTNF